MKLLPCPFCGGAATFESVQKPLGFGWTIGCSDRSGECFGYQSLQTFPRKIEAANAWNTRKYKGETE